VWTPRPIEAPLSLALVLRQKATKKASITRPKDIEKSLRMQRITSITRSKDTEKALSMQRTNQQVR
jgi:hypothetical protein